MNILKEKLLYISFDTNILLKDPYLKGKAFKELFLNGEKHGYALFLSNVVFEEAKQHIKEQYSKFITSNKRNFQIIDSKYLQKPQQEEISTLIEDYELFLDNKFREYGNINFKRYSINSDSFQKILDKSIKKEKPFKSSGVGFKDATIWIGLLNFYEQYYRDGQEMHFITENTNDFYDKENDKIHPDLLSDLEHYSFNSENIIFHKSLDEFLSKVLIPQKNELNDYIESNKIKTDIENYILKDKTMINGKEILHIYNMKINDIWKSYLDEKNYYNIDVTIFARTLKDNNGILHENEIEKLNVDIKLDGIGNIYNIVDDL